MKCERDIECVWKALPLDGVRLCIAPIEDRRKKGCVITCFGRTFDCYHHMCIHCAGKEECEDFMIDVAVEELNGASP